ncbi:QacE family quaternary ammonium compound efflux SMR transporter [Virgibacillus sp. NKC19-3]|uniref:DMT family transporter n=1 Tax=Virgibacillus saliphilus TaxID=2831674 RepID=UPI001C9B1C63|nr:SMR family transporter [Virgibacillus sp. NKC19-3]MBY7142018.1 QacE family quaternary ammonium compound efflux SMR transporter [Virgibacillus sp. NKC19-3]
MYYFILILSIIFEVNAATFMSISEGFTALIPSIIVTVSYFLAITLYIWLTKVKELSTINALWSGGGTLLINISGIFFLNESVSVIKAIGILCIVLGIVGLRFSNKIAKVAK